MFLLGESQGQWGLVDCITGEVPSSDQEETGELPDVMKKITEEGNLPENVFNADRSTLFLKKKINFTKDCCCYC